METSKVEETKGSVLQVTLEEIPVLIQKTPLPHVSFKASTQSMHDSSQSLQISDGSQEHVPDLVMFKTLKPIVKNGEPNKNGAR